MSLEIRFELTDSDIAHFRGVMARVRDRTQQLSRDEIVNNARQLLVSVRASPASDFIRQSINVLETMIGMIMDKGWGLPDEDAQRVIMALSYFSEPEDLIPDSIPALGFLDDAIMVDLVAQDLRHEIEAYRDFVVFRAAESNRLGEDAMKLGRSEWLEERRKQLHARMHRRRNAMGKQGPRLSLF